MNWTNFFIALLVIANIVGFFTWAKSVIDTDWDKTWTRGKRIILGIIVPTLFAVEIAVVIGVNT